MRKILVINDLHIGVSRVAGATPQTALDLRLALIGKVRDLMLAHLDKHIVINGDLFDAFDIPMGDALAFYETACEWLEESFWPGPGGDQSQLVIGRGNHDISKDSSRLSMFDFVTSILKSRFPDRVTVVTEPQVLWPQVYMVPHCTNQEIFDLALKRCLEVPPSAVLLHANYDNKFAVEQDHSLNCSVEQAQALVSKGHTLIFGHEHQAREPVPGVIVAGNQFPTSVADCLGNADKHALVIEL